MNKNEVYACSILEFNGLIAITAILSITVDINRTPASLDEGFEILYDSLEGLLEDTETLESILKDELFIILSEVATHKGVTVNHIHYINHCLN